MSPFNQNSGFRPLSVALAAIALLLGAGLPSRAHIVPVADMLHGITLTQAQCATLPQTLWLSAVGGDLRRNFCIRYYLSTAGGEGSRPVDRRVTDEDALHVRGREL